MRKLLAFGAAALLSVAAWGAYPSLTINGEAAEKAVTSLTFSGDYVIVHFGDESESYDMESVVVTFPTTGIDKVEMLSLRVNVGDQIVVDGVSAGDVLDVYSATGRLCARAHASSSTAVIDLKDCAPGVYVLRAGKKCVKFVKR